MSVLRFDDSGGRLVSGSRVISWLFLSYIEETVDLMIYLMIVFIFILFFVFTSV